MLRLKHLFNSFHYICPPPPPPSSKIIRMAVQCLFLNEVRSASASDFCVVAQVTQNISRAVNDTETPLRARLSKIDIVLFFPFDAELLGWFLRGK